MRNSQYGRPYNGENSNQNYRDSRGQNAQNAQNGQQNNYQGQMQNPLMDSKMGVGNNINLEGFDIDQDNQAPDSERENDLKNLVGIVLGKVQLKRMEPALLIKLQNMEQYYDLLPFNIRGFKLTNRASLLEGNFIEKYIIKQTQDLNLDLKKGEFEKHYLIDAAIKSVKNTPCWSFFISLVVLILFLLQLILDPILLDIIINNQPAIDAQIKQFKGVAHTAYDEQIFTTLEDETLAISFLGPLILLRLLTWLLDVIVRFIALHYFRKQYIIWTLLLDFIMICFTVIIIGFTTRLDLSLSVNNQSRAEIIIRNVIIFILFIVAMVQARKAQGVIKRLGLLFTQSEQSCCNFKPF